MSPIPAMQLGSILPMEVIPTSKVNNTVVRRACMYELLTGIREGAFHTYFRSTRFVKAQLHYHATTGMGYGTRHWSEVATSEIMEPAQPAYGGIAMVNKYRDCRRKPHPKGHPLSKHFQSSFAMDSAFGSFVATLRSLQPWRHGILSHSSRTIMIIAPTSPTPARKPL